MSIEGQGHFFTIYFPGFVCFVLNLAMISGERLQDHWSSGLLFSAQIHAADLFIQQCCQNKATKKKDLVTMFKMA